MHLMTLNPGHGSVVNVDKLGAFKRGEPREVELAADHLEQFTRGKMWTIAPWAPEMKTIVKLADGALAMITKIHPAKKKDGPLVYLVQVHGEKLERKVSAEDMAPGNEVAFLRGVMEANEAEKAEAAGGEA